MNKLIRRLVSVYRAATLTSGASAASLSERVTESKPGSSHLGFGDDQPLPTRMEVSLDRWLDVWEREVEGKYPTQLDPYDKVSAARKAQVKSILGEVGLDPTAVAYMYGSTTENVEKLRGKYGRDPQTGQRASEQSAERVDGKASKQRPLTAPARTGLQRLEERHADGEVGT